MLSPQNKSLASLWPFSSSLRTSLFGQIANEKDDFSVNNNGDVESRLGFGSGSELCPGQIPIDLDFRSSGGVGFLVDNKEFLGSMSFPKNEGLDMEIEREGRERRWVGEI